MIRNKKPAGATSRAEERPTALTRADEAVSKAEAAAAEVTGPRSKAQMREGQLARERRDLERTLHYATEPREVLALQDRLAEIDREAAATRQVIENLTRPVTAFHEGIRTARENRQRIIARAERLRAMIPRQEQLIRQYEGHASDAERELQVRLRRRDQARVELDGMRDELHHLTGETADNGR